RAGPGRCCSSMSTGHSSRSAATTTPSTTVPTTASRQRWRGPWRPTHCCTDSTPGAGAGWQPCRASWSGPRRGWPAPTGRSARFSARPELPIVQWPEDVDDDQPGLVHWKTRGLVDWAAGRRFVWIDDEITDADRRWVDAHHAAPALLHHVDPRRGLTRDD